MIAGAAYVLLFAGANAGLTNRDKDTKCGGEERWKQKVLIDDLVTDVNTTPKATTIAALNSISTSSYDIKGETPRQDIERQVYTVKDVFITDAFLESDNDIHMVIEDGNKHTMVAEIPDTKCKEAKSSEFLADYKQARQTFLKYKDAYNHYRFDVTGVLFIDKKHPKPPTGNWPNNIELHPVLHLKMKSSF